MLCDGLSEIVEALFTKLRMNVADGFGVQRALLPMSETPIVQLIWEDQVHVGVDDGPLGCKCRVVHLSAGIFGRAWNFLDLVDHAAQDASQHVTEHA